MKYLNDVTVYIYYIKDKYKANCGDVPPTMNNIFAFTSNKKIAKMFEEQRNMKMFKKDKKEMTQQEYNEFIRFMVDNDDRYLDIHEFIFYSNGINISKNIAISKIEERRIIGRRMRLELDITTYCWYNPLIFNDKIYHALKVLKYNDISEFIGTKPNKLLSINKLDKNTIMDIINIDELKLVIDVIGGTLAI